MANPDKMQKRKKEVNKKFLVNFPAYSHWSRSKEYYIEKDLITIGCTVVKRKEAPDPRIICEVPEAWHFKTWGSSKAEGYTDNTYTTLIFTIKENMNTGRLVTVIDPKYLANCKLLKKCQEINEQ